jgi:hypothetical protein
MKQKFLFLVLLFTTTILPFNLSGQSWVKPNGIEKAIIATDSSKASILLAIKLMLQKEDISVDTVDEAKGMIQTRFRIYVPEHKSGMIEYPITMLEFRQQYEFRDNFLEVTLDQCSDFVAYCVNGDKLCNCISIQDSVDLEEKAKAMGRFAASFDNEYSVWFALYKNQDVGFKLSSDSRDFSKEYENIHSALSAGKIVFLKHSDYVQRAKTDFGNKFAKEHTSIAQEKMRTPFIWIDKDIWDDFVAKIILNEFADLSKVVGGRIDKIFIDNNAILISVNNRLVPTNKKDRKSWYKANSISKEEEAKIESSFN